MRAQVQELQLEWTEVLDKLAAWTSRQSARDAQRVKKGLKALTDAPDAESGGPSAPRIDDPAGPLIPVPPQSAERLALRQRSNLLRRRDGTL
jgi:hypothetical protein